jgi:TolB-like protein
VGSELRYVFDACVLDADRRELRRDNELVPIEPQVFDLLEFLIRNRERVVSRDDLFAAIWAGRVVSESALSTRINAARSAIGDTGEQQNLIKTLPRKGVRFVGTVREEKGPNVAVVSTSEAAVIALPDKPSIAVLPFTNMSGDPEQDYFADGMAEEIITSFSRCSWLFVIARNSSFTYKGRIVDVRQIGRELGVRYVLKGSVRRAGSRLRIIGQLIDATTGAHIWADRFDGEMSDVFELQDRITESVVAAIEPKLQLAEIKRLKHKPAGDLDALTYCCVRSNSNTSSLLKVWRRRCAAWSRRLRSIQPMPQHSDWRLFAMRNAAFRGGQPIRRPRRLRGCVMRNARSSLLMMTPMSCGWRPTPFAIWGWIRIGQRKLFTVRFT